MSRGQTWSDEETRCLLDIWADTQIAQLLEKTHKNAVVFSIFSEKMRKKGLIRSPEQCRVKVKKLRQKYQNVRDKLNTSGNSPDVTDQCPWYDELDKILGTRPTVCPVDIVETNTPAVDDTASSIEDLPSPSTSSSSEAEVHDKEVTVEPQDGTTDVEDHSAAPSSDGSTEKKTERIAVPGAQGRKHLGRKRKPEDSKLDGGLQAYITQQTQQLQQMFQAEQNRTTQENTALESLLKAQQEAEDKRFKMMQAQQQAHTQMVSQILGTVVNLLSFTGQTQHFSSQHPQYNPSQAPTSTNWLPTASSRSTPTRSTSSHTWSQHQSPVSQTQHLTQPMQSPTVPAAGEAQNDTQANQPMSDILRQVNYNQHFYDL